MIRSAFINLIAFFALIGSQYLTAATTELACWEPSFDNNVFRVEITAQRLYVTIQGVNLVSKPSDKFVLNGIREENLDIGRGLLRQGEAFLVASFDLDQCQVDRSSKTFFCSLGDAADGNWHGDLYLSRVVDDLGSPLSVLSRFMIQQASLEVSNSGLVFKQKIGSSPDIETQTLQIPHVPEIHVQCSEDGAFAPRVPERLINQLEARR